MGASAVLGTTRRGAARGRGVRGSEAALGQICMTERSIERSRRKSESWLQEPGRERCMEVDSMRRLEGRERVGGKPVSSCCRVCVSAPLTPIQDGTPEVQRKNMKRPTYYSEEILAFAADGVGSRFGE